MITSLVAPLEKRDDAALWGCAVLVHLWSAVFYLKPGWIPALAGLAQLVVLCCVYLDSKPATGKEGWNVRRAY